MATMTLLVSDDMKEWIEGQLGDEFDDAGAYLRDLVARDREERDEARIAELRAIVDESLASGVSAVSVRDIVKEGRRIARHRGLL